MYLYLPSLRRLSPVLILIYIKRFNRFIGAAAGGPAAQPPENVVNTFLVRRDKKLFKVFYQETVLRQRRTIRQERFAADFASEKGAKTQESFVDFKFEQRISGVKDAVNRRRRYCAVLPQNAAPAAAPFSAEKLTGVRRNRASEIWTAYQREGEKPLERKKYGRKPGARLLSSLKDRGIIVSKAPEDFGLKGYLWTLGQKDAGISRRIFTAFFLFVKTNISP